jgi:hypothetical protein
VAILMPGYPGGIIGTLAKDGARVNDDVRTNYVFDYIEYSWNSGEVVSPAKVQMRLPQWQLVVLVLEPGNQIVEQLTVNGDLAGGENLKWKDESLLVISEQFCI